MISRSQLLRQGFTQLHGYDPLNPPDPTPAHEASYTLSQQGVTPSIPQTAANIAGTTTDAFTASHTLSNAAFVPLGDISPNANPQRRVEGLAAYVTQDIDPASALFAKQTFGNTPEYLNDHTTNMGVGRALVSAAGYTGDPALYLRDIGSRIGITFPSDFENDNQLYSHIGAQFAQRERANAQKKMTAQKAKPLTDQEATSLGQALVDAVEGKNLRPYQTALLKRTNINQSSIRKVQYLLQNGKLPGVNVYKSNLQKKFNSRFNEFDIDELADFIGDDPVARYIVMELARRAGIHEQKEFQQTLKSSDGAALVSIKNAAEKGFKEAVADVIKPIGRTISSVPSSLVKGYSALIKGDIKGAMNEAPFVENEDTRRRNAFRNDFKNAYNAGYQEQQQAIQNGTDAHWAFDVARYAETLGEMAGGTIPYFSGVGSIAALAGYLSKEVDQAASNALKEDALYGASQWELYGVPFAKTTIFGGSIAVTGAIAGAAAKGLANSTAIGKIAANRLSATPTSAYLSRFAEGTLTEAGEELTNAIGQEAFELTGLVADRQKQENWSQFVETMATPEFWGGNIGMNLAFAGVGLRGSRSKAPYQTFQSLLDLGFTRKESNAIANTVRNQAKAGATPQEIRTTVSDAIRTKLINDPEKTSQKLKAAAEGFAARLLMEEAASSGVRDHLLAEIKATNFKKLSNGNYSLTQIAHGEDGKFTSEEVELTEDELNSWLLSRYNSDLTQSILDTQRLVRGEKLAQTAESLQQQGNTPFARIVNLADAPAELLANLKGKDTFDMETLSLFAEYAINEIDRRMATGETAEEASAAEFGSTGVTLGSIANVLTNYQTRAEDAVAQGEITDAASSESVAFILPGKSTADQILMLARGQVKASDIAHDWMEGFARARFESDRDYWRDTLDALDRELLTNKVTGKSIFSKPEGQREDQHYIEALSHLAQANWLTQHDALNINSESHAIADEILEDISAIQSGIAFANELATFLNSEKGKETLGEKAEALNKLFAKTTSGLTDLLQESEKASAKTAAEVVLRHRDKIRSELDAIAAEVDAFDTAPPVVEMKQDTELKDTHVPVGIEGAPDTVGELAQLNGINPETGLLNTAPPASYTTVTAPNGAGRLLNGGVAHRMRDGSVIGVAPTASLSLHPSLSHIDLTKCQGNPNEPVIVYRKKDGGLHVIGGFARLAADQQLGLTNTEVRVYSQSGKLTHNWAADKAREHSIRAGLAHTRDIVKHLVKHKLSRTQARRRNLIPTDFLGKELPTSRAAWLLLKHAPAKTVANFSTGNITTREALADIAEEINTTDLLDDATRTASFSIRPKTPNLRNVIEFNVVTARNEESIEYMQEEMKKFNVDKATQKELLDLIKGYADFIEKFINENKLTRMKEWQEKGKGGTFVTKDGKSITRKELAAFRHLESKLGWIPIRPANKKNGDYEMNFDFGTLCVKREALDIITSSLLEDKNSEGLTPDKIARINSLLRAEGFAVGCELCFVEARRIKATSEALKFIFYWDAIRKAIGITDDSPIGTERTYTDKQKAILEEMASVNLGKKDKNGKLPPPSKTYLKYIPEDVRRREGFDLGMTEASMKRIAGIFLEDASIAGKITLHDLLTTPGVDQLFRQFAPHTSLVGFISSFSGAGTAKPLEGFQIYDNLSWKTIYSAAKLMELQDFIYSIGGIRLQSFSDYNPMLVLDYIQFFTDLTFRQLPLHVYTKVLDFVLHFGTTGAMINMSLIPRIDADAEHAGLDKNGNYAWHADSFPLEHVFNLRKDERYGGRVGTIAVGVSDEHIWKMLDDETIDMIIPYHASGLPPAVKLITGLDKATDYTEFQSTKPREDKEKKKGKKGDKESSKEKKKGKKGDEENSKEKEKKFKDTFSYNATLRKLGDPRKAADAYLKYCKKNKLIPKFEKFSKHKNYYKMLADFRGYDNNGKPVIQGPVNIRKLPENFKELVQSSLKSRETTTRNLEALPGNAELMKKAKDIAKSTGIDGDMKTEMLTMLNQALKVKARTTPVKILPGDPFNDAYKADLRESYGKTEGDRIFETLRMRNGIVYGYAYNNNIVLNALAMNANTPAHEFTHIWAKVAQFHNNDLWKKGVELLKETEEWKIVEEDELYETLRGDDDAIASEVLARIVGNEHEKFIRAMVDPNSKPLKAKGIKERILQWVQEMWANVRSFFAKDIQDLTFDEFSKMPLKAIYDTNARKEFNKYAKKYAKATAEQRQKEINKEWEKANGTKVHTAKSAAAKKLFNKDGVAVTSNAVITRPASFSIRAMHVSPANFRKFSTDFMGTGEGAQAYGWGLYFMTSVGVNKAYFNAFSSSGNVTNYRVELNTDDSNLLMWDKMLPPDTFRKALGRYTVKEKESLGELSFKVAKEEGILDYSTENVDTFLEDMGYDIEDDFSRNELESILTKAIEKANEKDPSIVSMLESMLQAAKGYMSGKEIYQKITHNLGSKKAASEWLAAQGYKGIKYLDGFSRSAGEGTYNYVIFSGDDIKIVEVNESGEWSMDEGWKEYTDPTATFSIRAKQPRRKYTRLKDMYENEQFALMLDEAKNLERMYLNFQHPEEDLDSVLVLASRLNALVSAISSVLPAEARPMRNLAPLKKRLQDLSRAAVNPHLTLTEENAKALFADEREFINSARIEKRRDIIAQKLNRAYSKLLKATAHSLEDYLAERLLESVERTIKTLQPKTTTSGRERRGLTDAGTFRKAFELYDMMSWQPLQQQEEEQKLMAILNAKDSSQEDVDNARNRLLEIHTYGGLRYAPVSRIQTAVNSFMQFVETGRRAWAEKLTQERLQAEHMRELVAKIQPLVRKDKVDMEANIKKLGLTNKLEAFLDSTMNPVQIIYSLGTLPGELGEIFQNFATELSVALDMSYQAIDKYEQMKDAALDEVLDITHKAAPIRDIERAKFLSDTNQYPDKEAVKLDGRIQVTNFRFESYTKDGQKINVVQELAEIRKEQGEAAFRKAIEDRVSSSNSLDYKKPSSKTYEEAYNDALAQSMEETYKGGTIYVKHYGQRDVAHATPLNVTQRQAANLVMTADQPSYSDKYDDEGNLIEYGTMSVNGYTDSVLNELEKYSGEKLMKWLRMLRAMLDTTGLYEAYEEHMGVPFPREKDYWPGNFETPKQGQMTDALDSAARGNGLHQMLIKRRDHIAPPDVTLDAIAVWRNAIAQHISYIHITPITRKLRRFLRDTDTTTRLADITSQQVVDNLIALLDILDGSPALVLKAAKPAASIMASYLGAKAATVLSGALATAVKNLSTISNGTVYEGLNPINTIPYATRATLGIGAISYEDLMALPVFKNRLHRDSLTKSASHLAPGSKQTTLKGVETIGMRLFLEYPDYAGNLLAMHAVANHKYDTLLQALKQAKGGSYEPTQDDIDIIREQVYKEVSLTMHLAAQPLEKQDKAVFLHQQNAATMAENYMRSEAIVKLGVARAVYLRELHKRMGDKPNKINKRNARWRAAWAAYSVLAPISMTNQTIATILAILSGYAPDDDDEFEAWLWSQVIAGITGFGTLSLIPFVGDALGATGRKVFELLGVKKYGAFATWNDTGLGISDRDIRSFGKLLDEDKELSSTSEGVLISANILRTFGTLVGTLGGSSKTATITSEILVAINTLLNTARPFLVRDKNVTEKETKRAKAYKKWQAQQQRELQKLLKQMK